MYMGDELDGLPDAARVDPLTRVADRREFERVLVDRLSDPAGESVGLLIADIDGLKVFNDTYGHHKGEEVLRAVARTIVGAVGPGDLVTRYGGDEFAVIIAGPAEAKNVFATAERIRMLVGQPRTMAFGASITVTISVGWAIAPAGTPPDGLVDAADMAMYWAKRRGKNCVEPELRSRDD